MFRFFKRHLNQHWTKDSTKKRSACKISHSVTKCIRPISPHPLTTPLIFRHIARHESNRSCPRTKGIVMPCVSVTSNCSNNMNRRHSFPSLKFGQRKEYLIIMASSSHPKTLQNKTTKCNVFDGICRMWQTAAGYSTQLKRGHNTTVLFFFTYKDQMNFDNEECLARRFIISLF